MRSILALALVACAADPAGPDGRREPDPVEHTGDIVEPPPIVVSVQSGTARWANGACPTPSDPYPIPAGTVYQLRRCLGRDCSTDEDVEAIVRDPNGTGGGDLFMLSCDRDAVYVLTWMAPAL